jgi:hypothetical protein
MTLRRDDGKWCAKRITLACTILGTMTGVIAVMPTATGYVSRALAPWVTYPDKLQHLEDNQIRLESKMDSVIVAVGASTNNLTTLHIK